MDSYIYDSDRHLMEPLSLWENYLDRKVFNEYPVTLVRDNSQRRQERVERIGKKGDIDLPPTYMVGGIPILKNWSEDIQLASAERSHDGSSHRLDAMNPEKQLISMDKSLIKVAYIFPTFAGYIVNHKEIPGEISLAYADAYNRWLNDYCACDRHRLQAVGLISRHLPGSMCKQLSQIITYGWTSITLRPEVIEGRDLGHKDYWDFWAACEYHNISVAFHGGTNLHASTVGSDRYASRFGLHACSHPMEAQMAFMSLLESGVLEQFPNLKFAFLEAGASWVPHWLWRLDNICYPEFPSLVKSKIKMLPSEYFKRQCWVAIELGEPCLREVVKLIGHKKLLYGSDFPHPDHMQFTTKDILDELSDFSKDEISDLLINNAIDFFGQITK